MVLHPLEFSECFLDSPWFRTSIKEYEDELERTNSQIKQLIKDAKAMLQASRKQGETMQVFSERLKRFQFEIIGENLTDAERGIAGSLKEFGTMLEEIEGEWTRTIERSELQLIQPLENFRKDHIHSYREAKKAFDKISDRYYKQMEQTLSLSHKKKTALLEESDTELVQYKKAFHKTSLNYVYKLQEVQERKKFEFVEHLLMFMQVYFNFFHQTHETATDCKDYMKDIQMLLVETRSQYEGTRDITQKLMRRMMDNPLSSSKEDDQNSSPNRVIGQRWARAGYLLVLDKSPLGSRFAAKWSRYFCMYTKENKLFQMIAPVSQSSSSSSNASTRIGSINHHGSSAPSAASPQIVLSCTRKATDSIDKRFCFDIEVEDVAGKQTTYTLQATSNVDRKKWIAAMDGKEPNYISKHEYKKPEEFSLNKTSIKFVKDVIEEIERRGVDAEGIYRLVGVSSKVDRLLQIAMDPDIYGSLNYKDEVEWELNTLTSALKNFFRNLPEPIMTFDLHEEFIKAAKQEDPDERLNRVISLVAKLSSDSQLVLERLIRHLVKVSSKWEVNKMTVQNIGVCFGPTLMRPKQETVQSIMEIKFNNIIVEILIENHAAIFGDHESQNGQERKVVSPKPTAINNRPSMRVRAKPRGARRTGKKIVDPHSKQSQPSDPESNSRFQRGHAIRGPPGRPLSPRMKQRIATVKAGSDDEEGSLSSSDYNTDEFGRISPLDLNIDLDHFSVEKSPSQGRANLQRQTQQARSSTEEPVTKENWAIERRSATQKSDSVKVKEKGKPLRRGAGATQSERMHSPPRNNLNQNNSNHSSQGSASPTVQQRKRQLLSHSAKQNQSHPPVPDRSNLVKRIQHSQEILKPTVVMRAHEKGDAKDRPSSIDFDKLKEKFSPKKTSSDSKTPVTNSQIDSGGDPSMSFLWPKPGSLKANSYVEADTPLEQRPRSTVVSSRQAIIRTLSNDSQSSSIQPLKSPLMNLSSSPTKDDVAKKKMFVTMYACEAEHESELSFAPDEIVHDVKTSEEPGWLVGTINGHTGLIPENYVREKI